MKVTIAYLRVLEDILSIIRNPTIMLNKETDSSIFSTGNLLPTRADSLFSDNAQFGNFLCEIEDRLHRIVAFSGLYTVLIATILMTLRFPILVEYLVPL